MGSSPDGEPELMYKAMYDSHIRILDEFAANMAEFEPQPVTITRPPRPGRIYEPIEVTAVYEPNPSDFLIRAAGVTSAMNGMLFIRTAHLPKDEDGNVLPEANFTPTVDGQPENGWTFTLRGRQFRAKRINGPERGEILIVLDDLDSLPRRG